MSPIITAVQSQQNTPVSTPAAGPVIQGIRTYLGTGVNAGLLLGSSGQDFLNNFTGSARTHRI